MEDTQRPNNDMIRQWFPEDSSGELFKIQVRYESNDAANSVASSNFATLRNFEDAEGSKRTAAYRWNWATRSDDRSANEFDTVFQLVDTVNLQEDGAYLETFRNTVDIEQWMKTFALEHIVGNWDSYGYGNGQNMYAYKPLNDTWKLMIWDLDIGSGSNIGEGPRTPLFRLGNPFFPAANGDRTIVQRMYETPEIARAYWSALSDAVEGPMLVDRVNEFLDPRFTVLRSVLGRSGVNAPNAIKSFVRQRRDFILARLQLFQKEFGLAFPTESVLETSDTMLLLSGSAPFEVHTILVNDISYQIEWTSVSEWQLEYPVRRDLETLKIQGIDAGGMPVETASVSLTVRFTGAVLEKLPRIRINEWLALNLTQLTDPADGNNDDWLELYNEGLDAVDISGFTLTDELDRPDKWAFPEGTVIEAGGFLLIWADGETGQGEGNDSVHAGFQINGNGELIALFTQDRVRVDQVEFGTQSTDVSMGRLPDGSDSESLARFTNPTPGQANVLDDGFRILSLWVSRPDSVMVSWESLPGSQYQIQYKDSAITASWSDLGEPVKAEADVSTQELEFSIENPLRLFRVILDPEAGGVDPGP
jgi:hypothetical protein